jgi:hypothetical protein
MIVPNLLHNKRWALKEDISYEIWRWPRHEERRSVEKDSEKREKKGETVTEKERKLNVLVCRR